MRHATVPSAVLRGVAPIPVDVEVAVTAGVPGLHIIGMSNADAAEAAMRVTCAIRSCGFQMPSARVIANLAPASVRKTGCGLDLAIAVGILAATGQVDPHVVERRMFVGELSLDGHVRPVLGMVPFAMLASNRGEELVSSASVELPAKLCPHAAGITSIAHLKHVDKLFIAVKAIEAQAPKIIPTPAEEAVSATISAGKHVLVVGPRHATLGLDKVIRACLPELDDRSRLSCAAAASAAGLDGELPSILGGQAPLRSPHHSATPAAMLGGGMPTYPGEVTLANGGALLLEDLQEWKPTLLRQVAIARDDECVRIVRADGVFEMPSRFQLIATASPCPCGHFGDANVPCTCGERHMTAYQRKLEGFDYMFDEIIHVA